MQKQKNIVEYLFFKNENCFLLNKIIKKKNPVNTIDKSDKNGPVTIKIGKL